MALAQLNSIPVLTCDHPFILCLYSFCGLSDRTLLQVISTYNFTFLQFAVNLVGHASWEDVGNVCAELVPGPGQVLTADDLYSKSFIYDKKTATAVKPKSSHDTLYIDRMYLSIYL